MRAMLGPDHADRRQLADLVATEPPPRAPLPDSELASASAARIRIVIDDLIDLILGLELPTRTPMAWLPTSLTLLALAAHQLLGLRPRLRPPLRPRLRRIHRRRTRTRARVLTHPLLQPLQPILMLSKPIREINNELDTRLTPRVVNRLRLDTIHNRKIRCTNKESLPLAPTAERLPHHQRFQRVRPRNALADGPRLEGERRCVTDPRPLDLHRP